MQPLRLLLPPLPAPALRNQFLPSAVGSAWGTIWNVRSLALSGGTRSPDRRPRLLIRINSNHTRQATWPLNMGRPRKPPRIYPCGRQGVVGLHLTQSPRRRPLIYPRSAPMVIQPSSKLRERWLLNYVGREVVMRNAKRLAGVVEYPQAPSAAPLTLPRSSSA